MALITLCRRQDVEFTPIILQNFFMLLCMVDNLLSLHPRRNQVVLFNPLPNRVDWKNKWVAIESKLGFPFRPLIGHCSKWANLPSNTIFIEPEHRFMDIVARDLETEL